MSLIVCFPGFSLRGGPLLVLGLLGILGMVSCSQDSTSSNPENSNTVGTAEVLPLSSLPKPPVQMDQGFRFKGLSYAIAGESHVHLAWQPASFEQAIDGPAEIGGYRIYIAKKSRRQDYSNPAAETKPDVHDWHQSGFVSGETLFIVVRAVRIDGVEDHNDVEWALTPNPVRYVGVTPDGSSLSRNDPRLGKSPDYPYATIESAVGAAIASNGVNIYVERGVYRESIYLFDGMMLFGGFAPGFQLTERSNNFKPSRIVVGAQADGLVIAPGQSLCGIDGFDLEGSSVARRGLIATDSVVRISHSSFRHFVDKGLELRGENSLMRAHIYGCRIEQNIAEGISLGGAVDLDLRFSNLEGNGQEGLDAHPLLSRDGDKARLELSNCRIANNDDLGLNLDLAIDPNAAGPVKIRVQLRHLELSGNKDHGASIDVQIAASLSQKVDLKLFLENITARKNGGVGVHLDSDIEAEYSVFTSRLSENKLQGMLITGDASGSLVTVKGSSFSKNNASGIRHASLGSLALIGSQFEGNEGRAVFRAAGEVSLVDCVLRGNSKPSKVDKASNISIDNEPAIQIQRGQD